MTRELYNNLGELVVTITLPDGTPEHVWQMAFEAYKIPVYDEATGEVIEEQSEEPSEQ